MLDDIDKLGLDKDDRALLWTLCKGQKGRPDRAGEPGRVVRAGHQDVTEAIQPWRSGPSYCAGPAAGEAGDQEGVGAPGPGGPDPHRRQRRVRRRGLGGRPDHDQGGNAVSLPRRLATLAAVALPLLAACGAAPSPPPAPAPAAGPTVTDEGLTPARHPGVRRAGAPRPALPDHREQRGASRARRHLRLRGRGCPWPAPRPTRQPPRATGN